VFFGIRKKLPRVENGRESERESRSENTKRSSETIRIYSKLYFLVQKQEKLENGYED
jgi:hypothetical protein